MLNFHGFCLHFSHAKVTPEDRNIVYRGHRLRVSREEFDALSTSTEDEKPDVSGPDSESPL